MIIHLIVGARPNFIKISPLYNALASRSSLYHAYIIHTGQHYDEKMSKLFFDDLKMPYPFEYLKVGSGTHGQQTAKIIERYESFILFKSKPDLVVVAGDVNSTIACALVAKKLQIPVAHVEAGLRSYDEKMPEEINRVLTDRISDILFTPSQDAEENLMREGISRDKIFFVGNIMIDSLVEHIEKAKKSDIKNKLGIGEKATYILVTLHRPSNVDNKEGLDMLLNMFEQIGQPVNMIFPMHPRTRKNIELFGFDQRISRIPNLIVIDPVGYLDFLKLQMDAGLVLTDSGGIQEETTFLGIPCLTLRENTERPITVEVGTNQLVELDIKSIRTAIENVLVGNVKQGSIPKYWDGKTAERVVNVLDQWFATQTTVNRILL